MQNKRMDGFLFKTLVISGCENLKLNYPRIDKLNVFPVPDGDTGTNMKMTIEGGLKEIATIDEKDIYDMARKFARGMLMGARGNSGVILSQLFRGLGNGFQGKNSVNAIDLSLAYDSAVKQAYKAVMNPVEGTILTVAREASERMLQIANSRMTIREFFEEYIAQAKATLERTPELLPVLKEAGVVDSGGAGYVVILEGMLAVLQDNPIHSDTIDQMVAPDAFIEKPTELPHGYRLDLRVTFAEDYNAQSFNDDELLTDLKPVASHLIVIHDDEGVQIHAHADHPSDVLAIAQAVGEMSSIKITNIMLEGADDKDEDVLPEEKASLRPAERKKYGIVTVANGDGLIAQLKEIGADVVISGGQSMNPSTEDFINAYDTLNAEHIFVFPNNKNIFLAADQSAKIYKEAEVHIVDTTSIAQGFSALTMLDLSGEPEEILATLAETIKGVTSCAVTYSIRDTKIAGITIRKDDYIGIVDGQIVSSHKTRANTLRDVLKTAVTPGKEVITVIVGKGVSTKESSVYQKFLEKAYPSMQVDFIEGGQDVYCYIMAIE